MRSCQIIIFFSPITIFPSQITIFSSRIEFSRLFQSVNPDVFFVKSSGFCHGGSWPGVQPPSPPRRKPQGVDEASCMGFVFYGNIILGGELPTNRTWVTTLVINGVSGGKSSTKISGVNCPPLTIRGMNHQVGLYNRVS